MLLASSGVLIAPTLAPLSDTTCAICTLGILQPCKHRCHKQQIEFASSNHTSRHRKTCTAAHHSLHGACCRTSKHTMVCTCGYALRFIQKAHIHIESSPAGRVVVWVADALCVHPQDAHAALQCCCGSQIRDMLSVSPEPWAHRQTTAWRPQRPWPRWWRGPPR